MPIFNFVTSRVGTSLALLHLAHGLFKLVLQQEWITLFPREVGYS